MVQKKIQILNDLLVHIKSNNYIPYRYFGTNSEGEECCCAVGYVMKHCGLTAEDLEGGDAYMSLNWINIRHLLNRYSNIAIPILEVFNIAELTLLQALNDEGHRMLPDTIEAWIAELSRDSKFNMTLDYFHNLEHLIREEEKNGNE